MGAPRVLRLVKKETLSKLVQTPRSAASSSGHGEAVCYWGGAGTREGKYGRDSSVSGEQGRGGMVGGVGWGWSQASLVLQGVQVGLEGGLVQCTAGVGGAAGTAGGEGQPQLQDRRHQAPPQRWVPSSLTAPSPFPLPFQSG